MRILAIETSCDDTCIAVIKARKKKRVSFDILSNIVSSQVKVHKKYGGVYPILAKREHQKNLVPVLEKALKEAKILKRTTNNESRWQGHRGSPDCFAIEDPRLCRDSILSGQRTINKTLEKILLREEVLYQQLKGFFKNYQKPKIDAIAITIGPGLEPCLWVGVNFAKALSYFWNLPIIPVNHIESHILVNFLNNKFQVSSFKFQELFPAICLVVSGGHTQLILMSGFGKYKILGETRDDAAGECFDKVARILGLEYPGGPAIAACAAKLKVQSCRDRISVTLPRPMLKQKNYDFSFSGLKTAVLYKVKGEKLKVKSERYIQNMCYETQQAIIDVLIKKTIRAAKSYRTKAIILGGGVTANQQLRTQFQRTLKKEKLSFKFYVPSFKLCTDNAAMVGVAGYYSWLKGKTIPWEKIEAEANLRLE